MSLTTVQPAVPAIEPLIPAGTVADKGGVTIRSAGAADAPAIHALIVANLERGRLLPRTLDEITRRAAGFLVATSGDRTVGCAELAPLGRALAEVRSLVVEEGHRGAGLGSRLVDELLLAARVAGIGTVCAFTHDPTPFVRLGFSIVPHVWLPEKIAADCCRCPLFRRCGQHAMVRRIA